MESTMDIDFPQVTTPNVIGITVAIAGNVLISLALNCQKLAHKRMEREKYARAKERIENGQRNSQRNGSAAQDHEELSTVSELEAEGSHLLATKPLLPAADVRSTYGTQSETNIRVKRMPKRKFISKIVPFRKKPSSTNEPSLLPINVVTPKKKENRVELLEEEHGNESDYLKSKLWWLGFLLMNVGELGNFISYAFAPASVVAPLGTFALMANCLFAPLMLKERFRKRDLLGILIAIIGAITVVFASNSSEVRLDPSALVRAISQKAFVVYTCIYVSGACILAFLSERQVGHRWVVIDVGLCALFGGFTVLSTKGVSTLITLEWIEIFTEWITYPVLIVLISTGIGQIRYLNRALMRFDSKVVIPIQFVFFNLSAIVGSAILYGDFKKTTFHQFVTFLYGCAATFAGVFIIAWAPSDVPPTETTEEENGSDGTGLGTLGRGNRPTLVLSEGPQPILRPRTSSMSLMGLSPAQHLLLVHTPPRDGFAHPPGSSSNTSYGSVSPDTLGRRRAISWFGDSGTQAARTRVSDLNYNEGSVASR